MNEERPYLAFYGNKQIEVTAASSYAAQVKAASLLKVSECLLVFNVKESHMKFYANPYNTDATGFYFETYEEFTEKMEEAKDSFGNQVEEFMIDVIDGSREELQLVEAIKIDQGNIEEVIEFIDTSDENEWPTVFFLLNNNICDNLEDAKSNASDYSIVESSLLDAAAEFFDDCYIGLIPKASRQLIEQYIDYDKFANDCEKNGDMVEFEFGGDTYTCTNANQ